MKLQTTKNMLKLLTDVNKTINEFNENKENIALKKQAVSNIILLSDELKKSDVKYATWDDGFELLDIAYTIEIFIFHDLIEGPTDFYNKSCTRYNKDTFEEKLNVVVDFVVELPDILRDEEDIQDNESYNKEKHYWDSFTRSWCPSDKIPLYYKPKDNIKGRYRQGIKEEEKRDLQRNIFYSLESWNANRKSMVETKSGACLNNTKIALIDCAIPSHRVIISKCHNGKGKTYYLVKQENWNLEADFRSDVAEYFIKGK